MFLIRELLGFTGITIRETGISGVCVRFEIGAAGDSGSPDNSPPSSGNGIARRHRRPLFPLNLRVQSSHLHDFLNLYPASLQQE